MTTGPFVPGPAAPAPAPAPPRRRTSALGVLTAVLLVFSILGNAVLLVVVIGLVAALGGGVVEDTYLERVVEDGPRSRKIAVIRIEGLIEEGLVDDVRHQLDRAADDGNVRAVILRINSGGGYLTASDMLYEEVRSFAETSGKPIVAAMDAVAASGAYYAACGADTIIAQRTTVTGSIGVLAQFFFLEGLLKDKLGIRTVTLKMGDQKDWPNFLGSDMTPEQAEYVMTTLLVPGYEQFVDVVAEGRDLDRQKVLALASGRVYLAREALEHGLIDEVGYFGRAVEVAMEQAGLEEARVVEYVRPFGLIELLGVSARAPRLLDLGADDLAALASPRVMYLWTGQ